LDAYCGDRKRFGVRADQILAAFVELEAAIRAHDSFEIALVLVRFDHVASVIVNANDGVV
jgi:hypothetical protein